MMYILEGKALRYGVDELCRSVKVYNKCSHHEYILNPDCAWRLIYAEGERTEIPVWPLNQTAQVIETPNALTFHYDALKGDGRTLNVALDIVFQMSDDRMTVHAEIENNDEKASVMELYLSPVSGARSLSGTPKTDAVAWPLSLGRRVVNPAFSDLSTNSGFRKYEKHDQFHTDLCNLYPSNLSMAWFDWYNEDEGLYIGSHDKTHHTICLNCERDVHTNTLRMGVIQYPMLAPGEMEALSPVVVAPHAGDWHEGAKIYRAFMVSEGLWHAPEVAPWAQDFTGWLRVILKQHHMECNWTYKDIPRLFDEAEAAGMKTLFLLGWEQGGFARMWPDYVPDEGALGGVELLKAGIDYVHQKGGKVLLFTSYALLDRNSEFYKHEGGEECTVKSIWGEEIPFSETYCGEGTYRKMGNPPMPMYLSCPGSDKWQEKLKKNADDCLALGADGVLYDIGGMLPYFCYDKRHTHKKPSHACESKAARYQELRENIRAKGEDKIVLMEHNVDIFNQHMDIAQVVDMPAHSPADLQQMYPYTFPELVLTNREHGQDEIDYRHMINQTVSLGLRFDMTIWRCCGSLSDIPQYAKYLTEVNALREQYKPYLLEGLFRDTEGVRCDQKNIAVSVFEAKDGSRAALCWNQTAAPATVTLHFENGEDRTLTVPAQGLNVATDR